MGKGEGVALAFLVAAGVLLAFLVFYRSEGDGFFGGGFGTGGGGGAPLEVALAPDGTDVGQSSGGAGAGAPEATTTSGSFGSQTSSVTGGFTGAGGGRFADPVSGYVAFGDSSPRAANLGGPERNAFAGRPSAGVVIAHGLPTSRTQREFQREVAQARMAVAAVPRSPASSPVVATTAARPEEPARRSSAPSTRGGF